MKTGLKNICASVGVEADPPALHLRLGVSRSARTDLPVHGLRLEPQTNTCGWYIWAGEMSEDEHFFEPHHVYHIEDVCPVAVPFLGLPPGWRFLTDGDYVDVWFDPAILEESDF